MFCLYLQKERRMDAMATGDESLSRSEENRNFDKGTVHSPQIKKTRHIIYLFERVCVRACVCVRVCVQMFVLVRV